MCGGGLRRTSLGDKPFAARQVIHIRHLSLHVPTCDIDEMCGIVVERGGVRAGSARTVRFLACIFFFV